MIALLQRVAEAAVVVNKNSAEEKCTGSIGHGTLALIGVERGDGPAQATRLLQRILSWRMFSDEDGKMNLNLAQINGGLLLVPQFTLAADTNSGNRASFASAAPPELGQQMFDVLTDAAKQAYPVVEMGVFGADMQVSLVNDGPVTFWLQVRPTG